MSLGKFGRVVDRVAVSVGERASLSFEDGMEGIDSTDVSLDLNWFRKKLRRSDLEEREFKWGYSPGAITSVISSPLAIEHLSLMPLAFLLHQGSPGDAKIYEEIL